MSDKSLVSTLFNHPFSFAVGVGAANGLLAKMRDKPITPTAVLYLAVILGLGEAALASEEPEEERHTSVSATAFYSVLGVFAGVALFADWSGRKVKGGGGIPIAQRETEGQSQLTS